MRTLRALAVIGLLSLITGSGLLLTALFPPILKIPVAFLIMQDQPINADLIVVLSGQLLQRALWARDLYKQGFSKKILLIPPPPKTLRHELEKIGIKKHKYQLDRRILLASGIPLSSIEETSTYAKNTKDETRLVRAYVEAHAVKSILLVSSMISSRRQCWTFKRAFPSVQISCQPSKYERIRYDRKMSLRVVNEYLKLAANAFGIN